MQLTFEKERKCHFFADYFGKHFPCDLKKAHEYRITKQTSHEAVIGHLLVNHKNTSIPQTSGQLVIDVQTDGYCIIVPSARR
jgi:hypothetical protein